jgi:ADP-ribosylglycohydrolase
MLGAIIGDVIGSVYEHRNIKTVEFDLFSDNCRFTDDSVMSIAVAEAIMSDQNYEAAMQKFGRLYPNAGYGGNFYNWLFEDNPKPYNSWGNGSAMRVSPVGWAFNSEAEVLAQAKASSEVTHNHPEGIKGAQAVALAIFLARNKNTKETIKKETFKKIRMINTG